jgi:hypothetical protein
MDAKATAACFENSAWLKELTFLQSLVNYGSKDFTRLALGRSKAWTGHRDK